MAFRRAFQVLPFVLAMVVPTGTVGQTITATRIVVTDHKLPQVQVMDETGQSLLRLETAEPARLAMGIHSGQVAVRESRLGRVTLVETGLRIEGHGDHGDLRISQPRQLPLDLRGARPSHVVSSEGAIAVFFDGDGSVQLVPNVEGRNIQRFSATHAHHGVAFPFLRAGGFHLLISEAPAAGERPNGVVLRNPEGQVIVRREDCPRLHGEARSGQIIAFGCADGILLFDIRSGNFRKIANPANAGERMVRNLVGGENWRLFFGDFGADAMVIVDPDASSMRIIHLPARRLHFTLDPSRAETGFVLTEDGILHAFSMLDGSLRASVQVTGRYSLEGGAAVARPRLSAAGGMIAISDPENGRVLLHDAETLANRRVIATGGTPFDIVLVSLQGERH